MSSNSNRSHNGIGDCVLALSIGAGLVKSSHDELLSLITDEALSSFSIGTFDLEADFNP